jgi:hypothetical protein
MHPPMSEPMSELPRSASPRSTRPVLRRLAGFVFSLCAALLPCTSHTAAAQGLEPGGPTDMGAVAVGGSSSNFTFTFSATVPTTVSSVLAVEEGAQNQDFVLTPGAPQTCTGTITPPRSCNINVTMTPMKIGLRRGAILIVDNSGAVVTTQFLYGIGLAPQFAFSPVASTILNSLSGVTPTTFQSSSAVYDGAGNLYFNDYQNGRLLKRDTSGNITNLGSFAGTMHSAIAINGAGTLFLTLPSQGAVEVIKPGVSSTLLTVPGMVLTQPTGIAIDGAGFLYIADAQKNQIVRVPPDFTASSTVTTTGITLSSPFGLAVNHDNLFIADSGNGRIVQVSLATGVATALTSSNALNQPFGISVDPSGTILVDDAGGGNILQVSPAGTVTSLVGDTGNTLAALPLGVLVATSGDLVSSDATLGLVFISRSQGSLTFPTPTRAGSTDATDGYETLTVQNSGNQIIQFSASAPTLSSTDYANGPTNTCPVQQATSTPFAIAATCTYTFGFTPSVVGPDDAVASIRGTSTSSGAAVTGIVDLNGTGVAPITSITISTNPAATTPGTPVSFTVTALKGATPLADFTGTVTFTMTDPTGAFLAGTTYTFTTADAGTHTFPASIGAMFNTPGKYTITAKYGTLTGTSNVVTVLYGSTTTLTSSVNPVPVGGQTTLTATVAGSGTSIVPTGNITFYDGSAVVGSCMLSDGKCSYTPTIPVGPNQNIAAFYSGDLEFSSSTSNSISQTVDGYNSTTALTSSINPSSVGQATILTATVAATAGQTKPPTLTGSVTFYDGTTALATVTLTSGVATYSATFTTPGSHNLSVVYSGDTNYATSTSANLIQVVSAAFTETLSLTSSVNPASPGQNFTLTVTAAPTPGQTRPPTPTGAIHFYNGTTNILNLNLSNGTVAFTFAFSTPGSYPISIVYSGDMNYASSTAALTQVIRVAVGSQISLTTSANPVAPNTSVNLTASVAAAAAGQTGTPSGKVSFYDGTTLLGSAYLVNGVATLPATFATLGTHSLTAVYAGDSTFGTSTSGTFVETVSGYTASVGLTSSVNPSRLNQTTTLTATVAPTAGQTTPPALNGSVSFYDGTTLLVTVKVMSGAATYAATFTTTGSHSLTAVYSGDTNYGSATAALTQVVTALYTTQTALTAAPNPASPGVTVNLTATVSATAGQTNTTSPTETVNFYDGTTLLGTGQVGGGIATFAATFAATGPHGLTAVYSGDTSFSTSTSPIVVETIHTYAAAVTLTSSINPSVAGQTTQLTAVVAATVGQTTPPIANGMVSFYDGTTLLGTANLVNGAASLPATFTVLGSHSITALYSGDPNYGSTTSGTLVQVVNTVALGSTVTLTSGANPAYIQSAIGFTATVAPAAGSTAVPTGTVTFLTGTNPIGTSVLVNGVATLSSNFPAVGTYSITAVYSGDTVYSTSTSPAVSQIVEDFSFTLATPSGGSVTVLGGKTATYTFTLSPIGNTAFAAAVNFSISGFPSGSTYTLTPATVASSAGTTTITLAITPPVATALLGTPPLRNLQLHNLQLHNQPMRNSTGYAPIVLAFLVLPFALPFRRKRRPAALLLWLLVFAGALGLTGCLSDPQSGYYGTTPSTFALTVTATSGDLSHSANASLTRQ